MKMNFIQPRKATKDNYKFDLSRVHDDHEEHWNSFSTSAEDAANMHMKPQRIIPTILISGMLIACFSGCGSEKVTAESLINSAFNSDAIKSVDADVELNVDFDIDATSLFAPYDTADENLNTETKDDEDSSNAMMNVSIAVDCNMKSTDDLTYMKGNTEIGLFGMKYNTGFENYSDNKNNISYSHDVDEDTWIKSDLDSKDTSFDFNTFIHELTPDDFTNLVLINEKDKKDDTYDVSGTISYDSFQKFMNDSMKDTFTETDTDNMDFDVIMNFDRKTKQIQCVTLTVDSNTAKTDDYVINAFDLVVTVNSINDVSVKIPNDVIESAIEEGTFMVDSSDYDFDYSVDNTEYIDNTEEIEISN